MILESLLDRARSNLWTQRTTLAMGSCCLRGLLGPYCEKQFQGIESQSVSCPDVYVPVTFQAFDSETLAAAVGERCLPIASPHRLAVLQVCGCFVGFCNTAASTAALRHHRKITKVRFVARGSIPLAVPVPEQGHHRALVYLL